MIIYHLYQCWKMANWVMAVGFEAAFEDVASRLKRFYEYKSQIQFITCKIDEKWRDGRSVRELMMEL